MAKVRGHRMAKAAIENAAWDAEARQKQQPLWKLLGGKTREIQCGVSIGIQDSIEQLLDKIETELAAGYRRIKVKVKPGWDLNVTGANSFALARHSVELRCQLRLSARRGRVPA